MTKAYVSIERNGPVAVVRFDRGRNLNAFDGQLTLELTDAARSFHGDFETRAVVLTGTTPSMFHRPTKPSASRIGSLRASAGSVSWALRI